LAPALIELAHSSGQWSHLAILHGIQAILVEVVKSPAKVAVKQAVGDLEPLYSSAVGKAIYANLPERERREMGQKLKFERHTERTLRNLAALDKEAKAIRDSGVSFDRGEGNEQVTCIACPILDQHGYPRASIGISLVAAHLKGAVDQQYEAIARVVEAARNIEKALFGSDSVR
jgi:IclR family acetate operon transcriptional repressor